MISPSILTGIEQSHQCSGGQVYRSDIGALITIAKHACQCQILKGGRSAVFTADDVVDLMGKSRVPLTDEAILTSLGRTLCYCGPQLIRDINGLLLTCREKRPKCRFFEAM